MKKQSSKAKRRDSVIVNVRGKKSLSLEDVERAAKQAKRTQASNATVVFGEETEVPEDVMEAANKSHVRLTMIPRPNAALLQGS